MANDTHTPHPVVRSWWVRPDRQHSRALQLAAIRAVDPEAVIYVEGDGAETVEAAARSCDAGELLGVVSLDRLAPSWIELQRVLEMVHALDVRVYDLEARVIIDPASAQAVIQAKRRADGARRMPSREVAALRGRMGAPVSGWESMTRDERARARDVWLSAPTAAVAADELGMSRVTLYRWVTAGYLPPRGGGDVN